MLRHQGTHLKNRQPYKGHLKRGKIPRGAISEEDLEIAKQNGFFNFNDGTNETTKDYSPKNPRTSSERVN